MQKLNANIKFKLYLRWFDYMDIKILDNKKVRKFIVLSYNTSQKNTFLSYT